MNQLMKIALGTAGSLLLTMAYSSAQDDPPLLNKSVKRRLNKVNRNLDAAAKSVGRKDARGARSAMESAKREWDNIFKYYKGKFDEKHPEISQVRDKFASLEKELNKAIRAWIKETAQLLSDVDTALAKGDVREARSKLQAAGKRWKEVTNWYKRKLPKDDKEIQAIRIKGKSVSEHYGAFMKVAQNMRVVDRALKSAEHNITGGAKKTAEKYLTEAEKALESLLVTHKSVVDRNHAVIVPRAKRIADLRTKIAGAKAADSWEAKLRTYSSPAGDKYVEAVRPGMKLSKIKKLIGYFHEAVELLEKYKSGSFPTGKSDDLKSRESELTRRLKEFPPSCKKLVNALLQVGNQIQEFEAKGMKLLTAAKNSPKTAPKPLYFLKKEVEEKISLLDKTSTILQEFAGDHSAKIKDFKSRSTKLWSQDKELQAIRAQFETVRPDAYKGSDADALKKLARETALKAYAGKALRTTAYNSGWKTRVEYENGAWVKYQDMWAHVVVDPTQKPIQKFGHQFEGDFVLKVTVYLRKDEGRSVRAHTTQYADLMSSENVGK